MKPITLTEEHKSKLLEMCKKLFPEYTIYKIEKDNLLCGNTWTVDEEDTQESIVENEFNIHWFEFCMTHLCNKLYPLYDRFVNGTGASFQEDMFYHCVCLNKQHPIDYMYEQFTKLK